MKLLFLAMCLVAATAAFDIEEDFLDAMLMENDPQAPRKKNECLKVFRECRKDAKEKEQKVACVKGLIKCSKCAPKCKKALSKCKKGVKGEKKEKAKGMIKCRRAM